MARINPEFSEKLKDYGAFDANACYNCGNCTAVCTLSDEQNSFPRKMVRYSVLGLESEIETSLDPWLCYYCGECSTTCPREANPGELMMSLRRWLTARYDWTRLSGTLYRSFWVSLTGFILLALLVVGFGYLYEYNMKEILHYGHYFEMIAIAFVALVILLPNIVRMWWFTIHKTGIKASISNYLRAFKELIVHMFTQKRALDCDDNQFRWFEHLVLVLAYLGLLFTTVFLDWFGTDNMFIIGLGYFESALIFIVTFDFIRRRIQKDKEISKHSHPSDWFFVVWLFMMGLFSFLVRVFIDLDILQNNMWLYMLQLMVLVQWALLIVPFGKWTHFLYRSFAMYFQKVKQAA